MSQDDYVGNANKIWAYVGYGTTRHANQLSFTQEHNATVILIAHLGAVTNHSTSTSIDQIVQHGSIRTT